MGVAYLDNIPNYTIFSYKGRSIKFKTSKVLEYFTEIKSYHNGFLVVMAKFSTQKEPEEDYIELGPILENLLIEPAEFLAGIERVEIAKKENRSKAMENSLIE